MSEPSVSDNEARERAVDPTESFIVQAPAGSGKTELLIQRFLALLANVPEPEGILAITFTRKAAAEMRGRVIKAFVRGEIDSPPDEEHERKTWELARAALKHDHDCGWRLMEMPGRLRIQTIDSLCHSLTRQAPVTSEMGGVVQVVDDPQEIYMEAGRATLAEMDSEDESAEPVMMLLEHLGGGVSEAEKLLVNMLEKRSHWLPLVAGGYERNALEDALRGAVEEQLEAVDRLFPSDVAAEIVELCRYASENLSSATRTDAFPEPSGNELDAWKEVASLLLVKGGTWRAKVDKRQGFPATDEGRAMKKRLTDVIDSLSTISGLEKMLAGVSILPPIAYDAVQWHIMQALFDLLTRATAHLTHAFATRGLLDHQAVQEQALRALGSDLAPTELTERLDYAIHHILVDEFQDTSRGQFELLKRLIEGWVPGDGRTMFLVGDPMQSIYRFREAEVGLFLKAEKEGIGDLPLAPLTLRRNFRSREEIIGWVNRAFPSVLPEISDAARGAVSYSSSEPTRENGGSVRMHPLYESDAALEAGEVVELVRARLKELENPEAKISILVRSRTHFAAIVPALREAGIPFLGKNLEKLGERPEVQDLLALTRALLHPGDRTAWLAVLRAPWCGLSLADLTALFSEYPYRTLPDLIADDDVVAGLSADGHKRLARLGSVIDEAWKDRRRRPLARWIEGVWLAIGGPAATHSPVALDSAREFFDLLEELEEGGDVVDFAELETGVDTIYAPPDPTEGIRVELMTMHGAKGLEFDTVILPGLGRKTRNDAAQMLMWLEHPVREGNELLMAPIKGAFEREQDPIYSFIKMLDKEHDDYEHGRLLYVAATRAREQLHLFGHATFKPEDTEVINPPSNTLLEKLWPAVHEEFEQNAPTLSPDDSVMEEDGASTLPQTFLRFPSDWRLPHPPASAPLPRHVASVEETEAREGIDYGDSEARHVGTIVHQALMRIARDGVARWSGAAIRDRESLWARLLLEKGVSRDDAEVFVGRIVDALEQTLSDERGRWILDTHEKANSEYGVTGLVGGTPRQHRIDRTFVEDGVRWIIDFKTGMPRGESPDAFLEGQKDRHLDQLEGYARLFSHEGIPIHLGLYFPPTAGWIDWRFE